MMKRQEGQGARMQESQNTRMQESQNTRMQESQNSRMQGRQNPRMQGRNSSMPRGRKLRKKRIWIHRNAANIITLLRIIAALCLLPVEAFSRSFFILFTFVGLSDALDGIVARKLKVNSKFGDFFDFFADLIAAIICVYKVVPSINLYVWVWIWTGFVCLIRTANLIRSIKYKNSMEISKTLANKISGVIFFLTPYCYIFFDPNYIAAPLCFMATLAAIQERSFIKSKKKLSIKNELYYFRGIAIFTTIFTVITVLIAGVGGAKKVQSMTALQKEARVIRYERHRSVYRADICNDVKRYRKIVKYYCKQNKIGKYTHLALAMMQQESGGRVVDVMQSSASIYNKSGIIGSAEDSIRCGVMLLRDCLKAAEVQGPDDMERIPLAIQGYNYGPGYISWAKKRDVGYTRNNAKIFSESMKQKYHYRIYGDPLYAPHVLRYYKKITKKETVSVRLNEQGEPIK